MEVVNMALNTRTCEVCRNQVPLDKCKLFPKDPNKNLLVCEACCEQLKMQHNANSGKPFKTIPKVPSVTDILNEIGTEDSHAPRRARTSMSLAGRDAYFCTRCRYNFTVDARRPRSNLTCPYCGREDRLEMR